MMESLGKSSSFRRTVLRNVALIWHDVRRLWLTPFGAFLSVGILLLSGFFFFQYLSAYNLRLAEFLASPISQPAKRPSLHSDIIVPFVEALSFLLLFVVPIVHQRLIADERKDRNDDLVVLAGISNRQYVCSKFVSSYLFLAPLACFPLLFPVSLFWFGNPEFLPFLTSIIGLLSLLALFCSLSSFVFFLFPVRGISLVMSTFVLLFLYFFHSLKNILEPSSFWWVSEFSPVLQARPLFSGVLSLSSLYFFIGFSLLFVFGGMLSFDRERSL